LSFLLKTFGEVALVLAAIQARQFDRCENGMEPHLLVRETSAIHCVQGRRDRGNHPFEEILPAFVLALFECTRYSSG
jgi:hypothetical protein